MAQTMIDMQKAEIQELQAFFDSHTLEGSTTGQQWKAVASMTKMKNDADLQW